MADTKYLKLRFKTWWFNVGIPADVQAKFDGKTTASINLHTHDLYTAQQKRWALKAEWEDRFAAARSSAPVSVFTLDSLARELYESTLRKLDTEGRDDAASLLVASTVYFDALKANDVSPVADVMAEVERAAGAPLGPQGGRAVLRALAWAYFGRSNALDGLTPRPPETFLDALPFDAVTFQPVTRGGTSPPKKAPAKGMRFSEAAGKWLAARTRDPATALAPKTADTYRAKLKLFETFADDAPLNAITLSMAVDYKQALASLPPSWDEAIDSEPNVRVATKLLADSSGRMSGVTLSSYLSPVRSVFTWSQRHGYFDQSRANPFAGLSEPKPKRSRKKAGERLYETAELQTLVDAIPAKRFHPAQNYVEIFHWLPLIAAHSGMRIGEMAQLSKGTIKRSGANYYFDLTSKDIKTEAGERIIPVHPELIRCGLLKYLATIPDGESLWPSLDVDSKGKLGHHLPDRYKLYRQNIGLTGERLGMHGLRKNFNQAMIDAGVSSELRHALMGHSQSMNMEIYGPRGPAFKLLVQAVEKVKFPGLKLRRLQI